MNENIIKMAIDSFININLDKFPGEHEVKLFKSFVNKSLEYADNKKGEQLTQTFGSIYVTCEKLFETLESFDELKDLN